MPQGPGLSCFLGYLLSRRRAGRRGAMPETGRDGCAHVLSPRRRVRPTDHGEGEAERSRGRWSRVHGREAG